MMLLLLRQRPVDDSAVRLDASQINDRCERDVESEQGSKLFQWLVQDLVGAVGEPDQGEEKTSRLEPECEGKCECLGGIHYARGPDGVWEETLVGVSRVDAGEEGPLEVRGRRDLGHVSSFRFDGQLGKSMWRSEVWIYAFESVQYNR